MINYISVLNYIAVGIFGMVLSAAFCDILWTRKKILAMLGGMAVIFAFQGTVYFFVDPNLVKGIYPFITHIPLMILLCILNQRCLWPIISVLSAYLCCQLRRWLALLVVAVFAGGPIMQDIVELVLTIPILWLLIRFIAPAVRTVSHSTLSQQCQFGVVPVAYYGFDYLTCIYTDWLLKGVLVAVEFMPFVCSISYLLFVLYISYERQTRSRLEQTQAILDLQVRQSAREIAALRESQEKIRAYRHDMRHHMQYLSSCIENEQFKQAQGYIQEIYSKIDANKVTVFCENESANLIFSAFEKRANDNGLLMRVRAGIPQVIPIAETDLCVLLSNALENALHACVEEKKKGRAGEIDVSVYEKKGKLFLQIINSCSEDMVFADEIPITTRPGHGIGVRSICAIVEQYGGIYTFSAKDGRFILRISI